MTKQQQMEAAERKVNEVYADLPVEVRQQMINAEFASIAHRWAQTAGALAYLKAMEAEGHPAALALSVLDECESYEEWRYPNMWDVR